MSPTEPSPEPDPEAAESYPEAAEPDPEAPGPRRGPDAATPDHAFPFDPDAITWDDALSLLVALAADDLLQHRDPVPTLLAFAGDAPIAIVGLRPFGPGEVGQALLEILSLVVPLGADRLAFGAAGRVWSTDDPIVPVCADGDLRQRAIVVALADARSGRCRLSTSIHPFDGTGSDLVLHPPQPLDDGAPTTMLGGDSDTDLPTTTGPAATMLVGALEQREELMGLTRDADLLAQLGRVLLLGHALSLAPDPAAELTAMHGAPR